jgi:penicillin G amidase
VKKWIVRILGALAAATAAAILGWYWEVARQGASPDEIARSAGAKVVFDAQGIPTIEGESWLTVIEAQGYVVASERMFQMDLMRRSALGRLAAWFGEAAVPADERRVLEDWEGAAERDHASLSAEERAYLEAYAKGVNRFIADHRGRWGIEYLILRAEPEPWSGKDSLSILLSMCEQLTAFSGQEAAADRYAKFIGPEWAAFIFPEDHPWNQPMFGSPMRRGPPLPIGQALAMKPIDDEEAVLMQASASSSALGPALREGIGSNNWAWCGKTGCFVANDPHLGSSVPHIWYANRLRISAEEWVVGVSIPGLPGIVLGMNPYLAWAFTNVGEDVDDLLLEKVDADEKTYLAEVKGGQEAWKPIRSVEKAIAVKGRPPKTVTALFTHRGPLAKRASLGGAWASRQWLALKDGVLGFSVNLNRAKSIDEMNAALDKMRIPAQNVVIADRTGDLAYRTSGTGVIRKVNGDKPQPAIEGEWAGFKPAVTRPRIRIAVGGTPSHDNPMARTTTVAKDQPRFLATANERIWVDTVGHRWSEDLRKERIRRFLSSRDDFTHADMQRLQLDTESRYLSLIARWTREHADPSSPEAREVLARWSRWNGVAKDDPETFSEALDMDKALTQLAISRLKQKYLPPSEQEAEYVHWMRSAWVIAMLETKDGPRVFGLEEKDLADHLLGVAVSRAEKKAPPYYEKNRWASQHPFVSRIPLVGGAFAVDTPVQYGWRGVVRVEQPTFGASVRLVWDLGDPAASTWSLPVGQSGHIGSKHFRDLQQDWFAEKAYKVLDPAFDWKTP